MTYKNYRNATTTFNTSGYSPVQWGYLDNFGKYQITEDSNSVAEVSKYLKNDGSSLGFKKTIIPYAYSVYEPTGTVLHTQTYDGSGWSNTIYSSFPLYHGIIQTEDRIQKTSSGLYVLGTYSTDTHIYKTSDRGVTWQEKAYNFGYYYPTGFVVSGNNIIAWDAPDNYWGGCKVSSDDGSTFTDCVSGMRFSKIVVWGSDFIGFYGDRLFKSSTNGVSWNGTSYMTAGYQVQAPVSTSGFLIKDLFVLNNKLHLVTEYVLIGDGLTYLEIRRFDTYPVADGAGTLVSTGPGRTDNCQYINTVTDGGSQAVVVYYATSVVGNPEIMDVATGTVASDFLYNGVAPQQFLVWYDSKNRNFMAYWDALDYVWVEETMSYEYVSVGFKAAYIDPTTGTVTQTTDTTSGYLVYLVKILAK